MHSKPEAFPHIQPVGESAILVQLGDTIDRQTNDRVFSVDSWLQQDPLNGILSLVPGYSTLLIVYDSLDLTYTEVSFWVLERLQSCPPLQERMTRQIEIPVHYGGEDGPDLNHVAEQHRLTPEEVVQKHTASTYQVGMMGFTPGFAYLMGLDPGLATPRLTDPRTLVPAGSVGIAGSQTGIYPLDSPGGWQLIGKTDRVLFDPVNEPHFLLSPGDEVRFVVAPRSTVK